MNSDEFLRSQNIMFEMMNDRGFDVDETTKLTLEEFDDLSENDIVLTFKKIEKTSDLSNEKKIAVVWTTPKSPIVGINSVQRLAERDENDIVLIVPANASSKPNVSSAAKSAISLLDKNIQTFCVRDVMINITKHCRVPKHELVSPEEEKSLHTIYGPKTKYNHICPTDAVVRYYGWKRGQIVKITRPGNRIIYRTVS